MDIVVGEIVIAGGDRGSSGSSDSILEEQDVRFFITDDELQVVEVLSGKPSSKKVSFGEAGQRPFVEDVFKMFELKRRDNSVSLRKKSETLEAYTHCQSELEDIQIGYFLLFLF